jgi:hypothetical protein
MEVPFARLITDIIGVPSEMKKWQYACRLREQCDMAVDRWNSGLNMTRVVSNTTSCNV